MQILINKELTKALNQITSSLSVVWFTMPCQMIWTDRPIGSPLNARAMKYRYPSCSTSDVSKHLHLQQRPPHQVSIDNVKILDRDPVDYSRGVGEAVQIQILQPDFNRDGGKHQLSHMWDFLLDDLSRSSAWHSNLYYS